MTNNNVAVFIDAENVGSQYAKNIIETASNYGDVVVKRVFGDWTKPNLSPWKTAIEKYSLLAEQQFSFAKGKNSSDISLIIQMMIALFEKNIGTFVLASGDSDFTRLIQELREREKTVIGMGSKNSIHSYVNAFSEFIYLDGSPTDDQAEDEGKHSAKPAETDSNKKAQGKKKAQKKAPQCILPAKQLKLLTEIAENLIDQNGKALYSQLSIMMKNKYSDFIPQNYGCKQFRELMLKVLPFLKQFKEQKEGLQYYLILK